jgi:hypothetical protein
MGVDRHAGLGSTVLAISAFMAGLNLVGPATAAIVSTIEPVVTSSSPWRSSTSASGPFRSWAASSCSPP